MSAVFATTNKLRVGQEDTIFRVRFLNDDATVRDISSQTLLEIKFLHPTTGDITTETGVFTDDGVDGFAQFKDILAAYAAVAGTWKYWGRVTLGTDGPFPSSPLSYEVQAEGQE